MRSVLIAAMAASSAFVSVPASAAAVLVTNFSFEAPDVQGGTFQNGSSAIPGWTMVGNQQGAGAAGVQDFNDPSYFRPADGAQVVYINNGTITQSLGTLQANTRYTLTVAAGNQANFGQGSTGFIGFYSATGTEYSSTITSPQPVGSMNDFSTSFTTGGTVSGDLVIGLSLRSFSQVLFDNVRVDATSTVAAVPEPATWGMMLMGFGMVGFGLRARKAARVTYA